jgi:hypothetical protein
MKHALLALPILTLISCDRQTVSGPPVDDIQRASIEKSEMLNAEIRMGAGEISVDSAPAKDIVADFHYSSGGPKPSLRVDTTSFRARAVIDQNTADGSSLGLKENRWRIQLPKAIATDLDVKLGAGEARLNLGDLDLRKVHIGMGAGKVHADFLGTPTRDYEVKIEGGVGECEVYLPKEVGIRAEAAGGLGHIEVNGLDKKGDVWENAAYSNSKTRIHISVKGGVGEIRITAK